MTPRKEAIGFIKDSAEFLDTKHLILVDQNRRIRGVNNGTLLLVISHLANNAHSLLQEN